MKEIGNLNVVECMWPDVRNMVLETNPLLAEIIDEWEPSKTDYKLYKATYSYGDLILNQGELHLPLREGKTALLSNEQVPAFLKEDLGYSSAPIGLLLNNTVEVFIEDGTDVISLVVFNPGTPLGLLETFDPINSHCLRHIWSTCAGSRSVFMLPKISDKMAHRRLQKEFGLTNEPPKNYSEHFAIFKEIANSTQLSGEKWKIDLLFFSKKWFEEDLKNHHWLLFKNYFNQTLVQYSSYSRNKATFDVLWHLFSNELTKKHKRPNSFILDTLRHVVEILIGEKPGYAPILNEKTRGPFEDIQNIYIDIYRLNSIPTIIAPYHFSIAAKNNKPVYHSNKFPMMFETVPRMRETESLITELIQIASLSRDFYHCSKNGKFKIKRSFLDETLSKTALDFYHINPSCGHGIIKPSIDLHTSDEDFTWKKNKDLEFADTGGFIRSCVKIRKKEN